MPASPTLAMMAARRQRRMHAALCATAAGLLAALPAQAIDTGTNTTDFRHLGNKGVQVSANWVLTARHTNWNAGTLFRNGYGEATVAQVYHASNSPLLLVDDLSLLRLSAPIAAPQLSLLADEFGPGALAVPLAATMASGSNASPRAYAATQVYGVITQGDPDDGGPQPTQPVNWLEARTATFGKPHVQPGDSGSGLFLGHVTDSGSGVLIGIASALAIDNTDPNNTLYASAYVQLAHYRQWITDTMANDALDSQVLAWATLSPAPEPASWAMWLGGAGLLLAARRKARRG